MKRLVLAAAMAAFMVNGVLAGNVKTAPKAKANAKTELKVAANKANAKATCAKSANCAKAQKNGKKACCKAGAAKQATAKAGASCCKAAKKAATAKK